MSSNDIELEMSGGVVTPRSQMGEKDGNSPVRIGRQFLIQRAQVIQTSIVHRDIV